MKRCWVADQILAALHRWRAVSVAYLVRPNKATLEYLNELRANTRTHVSASVLTPPAAVATAPISATEVAVAPEAVVAAARAFDWGEVAPGNVLLLPQAAAGAGENGSHHSQVLRIVDGQLHIVNESWVLGGAAQHFVQY